MSGYTPGPWCVHERPVAPFNFGHHVTTNDGLTICSVTYQLPSAVEGEVVEATRIANARLIASAPDMRAALDRIDATLREFEGMTSTAHKYMAACIRKAMSDEPRDMEQEARETNLRG